MNDATRSLMLEIARCSNIGLCRADPSHPCNQIVGSQGLADLHLPEPWCGNLEHAPILFVSSNPGIAAEEQFPTAAWSDDEVVDYFANRFGGGRREWIREGNRRLNQDGNHSRARPYWSNIKRRAREILGRDPVPGADYAITEIVHCKSRRETGVRAALGECSGRYLQRVLRASGATAVVAIGDKVRHYLLDLLSIECSGGLSDPLLLEGRQRVVVFLGHPAGPKPKSIEKCLSAAERRVLRRLLTGHTSGT
jgi:hypothetical protein